MVLKKIHDHPILEHHAIRFWRGKLNRLKCHLPGIAQCKVSSTASQHRDGDRHGYRAQNETPSLHVSRFTFHVPHRATSCCGTVATFFSPAFFTNVATVRFDFVKYSAATRWISAGVTAAILSRAFIA